MPAPGAAARVDHVALAGGLVVVGGLGRVRTRAVDSKCLDASGVSDWAAAMVAPMSVRARAVV